jgi:microsomal dipeptidase-like Zn-dependent dipeptidase
MRTLLRKEFLEKVGIITLASIILPRFIFGRSVSSSSTLLQKIMTDSILGKDSRDYRIVDLHCHPSLKMYLWNQHLWKTHLPGPGTNMIQMQDDLHQLRFGHLKGLVVAHYLIEAAIKSEWNLLRRLFPWINRLFHGMADKIEHEDASNFTQINIIIDTLESQVHLVNERQDALKFVIARNYHEFASASEKPGQIAIAHAIEGGHALGRGKPISNKRLADFHDHPEKQHKMRTADKEDDPAFYYIRNLEALCDRGVCMITLAHIFKNDLADPVEGISEDEKKVVGMKWHYDPKVGNCDLSTIGIAVAKRMLELGMVIDLTHSTAAARRNVFEITRQVNEVRENLHKLKRPLAFTHVGLQSVFEDYDHIELLQNYKFYDIDDYEIDQICACDGVIGVIPENFWLTGADRKIQGEGIKPGDYRYGIKYIVETIVKINQKTRSHDYSNIAIGTDFDGFADAPKDLYIPRKLGDLIEAISKIPGISADQVVAITSGNALRLLERGWGDKMEPVSIKPVTMVGSCNVIM